MKKFETVYKVELTAEEIKLLTSALHNEFSDLRELLDVEDDPTEAERIRKRKSDIRSIRNFFGELIGQFYMGIDA